VLELARQGRGDRLTVSDASSEDMASYMARFGGPGGAELLLEPYARSTDQNARLVARLAKEHGAGSVLLVTSWIHQPRSYLLLRLALLGSGIRLRMLGVGPRPSGTELPGAFFWEAAKFWGSLGRWAKSALRGAGLIPWERPKAVD
jgi:uncharacterized SAM-binding protein YcdF (DUF218 family)